MVGMLRSGTTLTEQILASPPNVFGAGELSFWSSRLAGRVTSAAAEGASAMEFGDTALADLGNEYLELLRHLSRDALRVVDQMPTNQTARSVVTASKWQGRQQISTASVERWRRYEKFIGPLMPLLGSGPP